MRRLYKIWKNLKFDLTFKLYKDSSTHAIHIVVENGPFRNNKNLSVGYEMILNVLMNLPLTLEIFHVISNYGRVFIGKIVFLKVLNPSNFTLFSMK